MANPAMYEFLGANTTLVNLNTFTTAAALQAITLPAYSLAAGNILHLRWMGFYSATGTPTYTLATEIGSTATGTSAAIAVASGATGALFFLDQYMTIVTDGTSGTFWSFGYVLAPGATTVSSVQPEGEVSTVAINTTIANTFTMTAACSASSSSNTITGQVLIGERIGPWNA